MTSASTPRATRKAGWQFDPRPTPPRGPRPAAAVALLPPPPPPPPIEAIAEQGDGRHPLLRSPQKLPLRLPKLDRDFFDVIKDFNMAAEAGQDVAGRTTILVCMKLPATELQRIALLAPHMDIDEAEAWLGALGYLMSCLERQYRVIHGLETDGFALRTVPGLEGALLALGLRTGRPPRNCAWSAWAMDPPYSFTGKDGERRFGCAVRAAEQQLGAAADLMMPVRRGEVGFIDATDALGEAADIVADYTRVQAEMVRNPFPEDFRLFRNFLVTIHVDGEPRQGPNATFLPGWTRMDLGIGIYDQRFLQALPMRLAHMSQRHAAQVRCEQATPSIAYLTAVALGLRPAELATIDTTELEQRMRAAPSASHPVLAAAARLAQNSARLAGVHFGVIKANLVEPSESLADADRSVMTHGAGHGVSGQPLDHTESLMRMRLGHALSRVKFKL